MPEPLCLWGLNQPGPVRQSISSVGDELLDLPAPTWVAAGAGECAEGVWSLLQSRCESLVSHKAFWSQSHGR
jgi:hypothetical protein